MNLAVALVAAALLASPTAHESPSLARIERAFVDGEIDAPTRAIYGLLLLAAPEKLPVEFQPSAGEKIRCGTPLMKRAFEERDSYDAAQQALFVQFGNRPTLAQDNTVVANLPDSLHEVLVHYPDAVSPTLAQAVVNHAEHSWDVQVDQFGWNEPVLDDGSLAHGGTIDLDIYLTQVSFGGAYVAAETPGPGNTWTTFMVIDPDISPDAVMATYVAHELNHCVQYAYDDSESDWLYEATATYMEDKVYDAVNDYLWFVQDFQQNAHRTLSWASDGSDTYEYGGSVFLHYLSERFDNDATNVVRGLWTPSSAIDFFDALEDTILPSISGAPSDMMGLYADFAGYRWLAGSNSDGVWSDEASAWARVPSIRVDSLSEAAANGSTASNPPMKLGARYIEVVSADGANGDRLTFTLHGATDTAWAVTVIGQPASGAATVTVVRDDDADGEIVATSENNDQYERVVFAVSNLGVAGQNPDYYTGAGDGHSADITTSSFTYDLSYSATGGDPVDDDPVGCGCSSTRSTPSASWLLSTLLALATMVAMRRRT